MPSARFAALALAGLFSMPPPATAQTAPSLGSAASFAVLGGSAVTDSGSSIVTGNAGVSPGHTISGFTAGSVQIGAIYVDDALARQAQKDNIAAYADLAAGTCTPASGTTLGPGIYCFTSPLTGVLTLDAKDDPHAVWIFRTAALTTSPNAVVRVINGGCEGNVFWRVARSATLAAGTQFAGSILALSDITLENGASLSGRALSQTGRVSLDHNKVSLCCDPSDTVTLTPATFDRGSVGVFYSATFHSTAGTPPYTYAFSEGVPPGLTSSGDTLSGLPSKGGTYSFFVTATDARGCHDTREYTIIICGIVINPPELPKTCDVNQTITASGGTPPYTLTATTPTGVTFDPATGVLSGTPATPGCFPVTISVSDQNGCAANRTYTICNLGIEPASLPTGVDGALYPTTIIGAPGTTASYTCLIAGLPAGMVPTGCAIGGTPAAAGCSTVTVTVTALGFTCSRTYMLCVDESPIVISPSTLPKACAGAQYSQTFSAMGGKPSYTFKIDPPSPLGLTFANGVLSGVPQSAGCVDVTVTVTDGNNLTATKVYKNFCSDKVIVKPDELPDAQAGVFYSRTAVASGGEGDYAYSASGLSCGLSLDAKTGVISGTPAAGCSIIFTITATDKNGCSGNHNYQIDVSCQPIAISPASLPGGNVSSPYSQTITATGGTPPYTFTVVSGTLPPGLILASGGVLSGTPATVGTYCFDAGAADSAGCATIISYTIVISAASCPAGTVIVLSPPSLPAAITYSPYNQALTATGGTPPYTFAITSGTLPPGLTLNSATGVVSGTPTTSGHYTLTIGATDANGCFGSMGCTVVMTVDIPATSEWEMVILAGVLALAGVATLKDRG
ncbi:MAG TPA: putative Ig domain-containing protein [Thermoanaerobaculia bacterium]|nr:putative Ig domain-containing protein [Thermoanaerobaculia bacterium]